MEPSSPFASAVRSSLTAVAAATSRATHAAHAARAVEDVDRRAVQLNGVRKTFASQVVLDGVHLGVNKGEFVALLGASGTGKTTLLRLLGGLERPDQGEVWVPAARTIVFQEPRLVASMRVRANVIIGQRATRANRAAAERALEEVGLALKGEAWPATLSGGEAQRVALARALVREPSLLLLDEPFAALDALTRLQMQGLVRDLCRRHQPAVVLVTHDVDEALRLADRILVLRGGRFVTDLRIDGDDGQRVQERRRALLTELGVTT